ncbi:MAG TPA: SAM-dependent methyltransferase [Kineosporiaceae bacterium]|nr:SAM-dependent methyltransferase [Kineosporiaceae bacterium]
MSDPRNEASIKPEKWVPPAEVPSLDTSSVPHSARVYNYWLGGKDNYEVDRKQGDKVAQAFPSIRTAVQENRGFLRRAVRSLTQDLGIRQFLDIGTGLPSADNTHEVAQAVASDCRVVYVDNDPLVLVHARALLTSSSDVGVTDYLDADVRDSGKILEQAARTLDFTQPVALMLVAIMHFISDEDKPYDIVAGLVDALPSGSYIAMSHATGDFLSDQLIAEAAGREVPVYLRSRAQFEQFFHGLELVEPGIVSTSEWRPEIDAELRPAVEDVAAYGAVARVP